MVTAGSFRAGGLFIFVKEMINIAIKLLTSVTYTATGEQTTFAIPFDYLRPAFVYVSVDEQNITEGFEVVDRTVKFSAPPAKGAVVRIYRSTTTKRLVSWADASILKAKDMTVAEVQQLHLIEEEKDWSRENTVHIDKEGVSSNQKFDPSFRVKPDAFIKTNSKGTGLELYDKADMDADIYREAGKYINDHPEYVTTVKDNTLTESKFMDGAVSERVLQDEAVSESKLAPTLAKKKASWYKSVAEMKADSLLSAGMTACTLGYYSPNDGGAATYIIHAKQESDVDDGGSLHELASGLVAELVVENGTVCPEQFGAKGDGVADDTNALKKAINVGKTVFMSKKYSINSPLEPISHQHIIGKAGTTISAFGDIGFPFLVVENKEDILIESIIFDGKTSMRTLSKAHSGLHINNSHNVAFKHITIKDCGLSGNPSGNGFSITASGGVDCYDNVICDCNVIDDFSNLGFGVRLWTDFFNVDGYCRNNTITNCCLTGCDWNAIELAGLGTVYNTVSNIYGKNITALAFIEADKASSYNKFCNIICDGYIGNSRIDDECNPIRIQSANKEDGTKVFGNGNVFSNITIKLGKLFVKDKISIINIDGANKSIISNVNCEESELPDSLKVYYCIHITNANNSIISNCIFEVTGTQCIGLLTNQDADDITISDCHFIFSPSTKSRIFQHTANIEKLEICRNIGKNAQLAFYIPNENVVVKGRIEGNTFDNMTFKGIGLHTSGCKFYGLIANNIFYNISTPITADDTTTYTYINNISI